MCGRIRLSPIESFDMKRDIVALNDEAPLMTTEREICSMRWGMNDLYWARGETIYERPTFASCMRAIVMVEGWWERGRLITPGHPTAIACLWLNNRFVMVTQAATGNLATIHHRMPAIVNAARWLDHKQLSRWMGAARIEVHA